MYGLMLEFGPGKLMEEFAEQYVVEYGQSKFKKIADLIRTSSIVNNYISQIVDSNSKPDPKSLRSFLNSQGYFKWSKQETICLGALGIISRWSGRMYTGYDKKKDQQETEVIAKLIDYCSRQKYNQGNNFFDRFYRRLRLIVDSNED